MAEEKEDKRERKAMVYCKNNVYLASPAGKAIRVKKGLKVLMSTAEIKHFGKAVTKDVPDDAVEFERVS